VGLEKTKKQKNKEKNRIKNEQHKISGKMAWIFDKE
jgi:hypothetical protein